MKVSILGGPLCGKEIEYEHDPPRHGDTFFWNDKHLYMFRDESKCWKYAGIIKWEGSYP